MTNQRNKRKVKRLKFTQHTLIPILMVTFFASVGAYLVFKGHAETGKWAYCVSTTSRCEASSSGGWFGRTDWFGEEWTQIGTNTARIDFYVDLSEPELMSANPLVAGVNYALAYQSATYTDNPNYTYQVQQCFDLTSLRGQKKAHIFSFTTPTHGDPKNNLEAVYGITFFGAKDPGCKNDSYGSGSANILKINSTVHNLGAPNGYEPGPPGSSDPSKDKTGGSSGSTAKKQSNQPNSLPSSSSQGDSNQTTLEPSPFIDGGKTYQPGSDPDTLGSSVSRVGKKLINGWYLLLILLFLASAGGYGYWWWRRKHS